MSRLVALVAVLAASSCRMVSPRGQDAGLRAAQVVVTAPEGGRGAAGFIITRRLGDGVPRLYLALRRSALEAIAGDSIVISAATIPPMREAVRAGGRPLWVADEKLDAAVLPIRLPIDDMGGALALESARGELAGLPAPPRVLMRLADEVPLK